jgi:hypothetical protein
MLSQDHFPEPNGNVFSFLHPIFLCGIKILSTAGDALKKGWVYTLTGTGPGVIENDTLVELKLQQSPSKSSSIAPCWF